MTGEDLVAAICSHIERDFPSIRYYHSRQTKLDRMKGYPDLTMAGPRGILFAECKGRFEDLASEQVMWKYVLKAANQPWMLWRPPDWYNGLIRMQIKQLA